MKMSQDTKFGSIYARVNTPPANDENSHHF